MNIVVLAGGLCGERDVSLTTGTLVCNSLIRSGHRAILVDLYLGIESLPARPEDAFAAAKPLAPLKVGMSAPDLDAVRAMRTYGGYGLIGKDVIEVCRAADIVFLALHGDIGENGKLQALFDIMGIRYTGSGFLGSTLAMDKAITKQLLRQNGIRTPSARVYGRAQRALIEGEAPFPCIVKPLSGGSSIGIRRAFTPAELELAVEEAFCYDGVILVEQYIEGRELTCGVLGDAALPPAEIIPKGGFYDYAHKYQDGYITELCPAPLTPEQTREIQRVTLKVFELLRLNVYARIDYIMDRTGELYCLEANTLPGLTPTSHIPQEALAAGIDYDVLCLRIVELSLGEGRPCSI